VKAPQRCDVWLVDLGLVAKVRPSLVVSIPVALIESAMKDWLGIA
jgi:mRNA-degrading endonuclease toxin of MazEF toxin-antitoxin module